MLSSNTSVRTRFSPANSPRNSPCSSPRSSPHFMRKFGSHRKNYKSVVPVLAIHCDPSVLLNTTSELCLEAIKLATNKGYEVLVGPNSSVTEAVKAAVHFIENDPIIFQGVGDASSNCNILTNAMIMEGRKLRAGCILHAQNIHDPVNVANHLMQKNGEEFTLYGEAADKFAEEMQPPKLIVDNSNVTTCSNFINSSNRELRKHSIGVVAVDSEGHVACAWSSKTLKNCTGHNDTFVPLATVGSAAFCDDYIGAVSCVGGAYGSDAISRVCLSRHICGLMQQSGMNTKEAVVAGLEYVRNRMNGVCCGAVAVANNGEVGVHFTTDYMPWAYRKGDKLKFGVNPTEYLSEDNNGHVSSIF